MLKILTPAEVIHADVVRWGKRKSAKTKVNKQTSLNISGGNSGKEGERRWSTEFAITKFERLASPRSLATKRNYIRNNQESRPIQG